VFWTLFAFIAIKSIIDFVRTKNTKDKLSKQTNETELNITEQIETEQVEKVKQISIEQA
jgi:hypothetical protein